MGPPLRSSGAGAVRAGHALNGRVLSSRPMSGVIARLPESSPAESSPDSLAAGIDSDAIHRFSTTGLSLGTLTAIDTFPEQVAVAANGNVLIANFSGTQ